MKIARITVFSLALYDLPEGYEGTRWLDPPLAEVGLQNYYCVRRNLWRSMALPIQASAQV